MIHSEIEIEVVKLFDSLKYYQINAESSFIYIKDEEGNVVGYLEPVRSKKYMKDYDEIIHFMAKWRDDNQFAFPTRFEVTEDSTRNWLHNNVIRSNHKILFIVRCRDGKAIGHMGLASFDFSQGSCEIDNVVKGDASAPKGIMSMGLRTLIDWTFKKLPLNDIYLRVIYDNERAINYYKNAGFLEDSFIPLTKKETENRVELVEAQKGDTVDSKFLKMRLHKRILTAGPSISTLEIQYVTDAVQNGWNENWNYYIKRFEEKFADYIGVKYAITTSSCTGAMHAALLAMGVGPGDEVILPDLGWAATGHAVLYTGAKPVLVDVDMDYFCIEPEAIKENINDKTKAIIPVHMYGHPAKMDDISEIAKEHGIKIMEDAAPSIGSELNGQKTGSLGDIAAFSFQGAKMMVTGEGGMLVTNNKDLYEKSLKILEHGRSPNRTFWIDEIGLKYKMSNIQAALGLAQLQRVDSFVDKKILINKWYQEGLKDLKGVLVSSQDKNCKSTHWMTSLVLKNQEIRDNLINELNVNRIDTRPFFNPMSQFDHFTTDNFNENSLKLSKCAMNLPSGCLLEQEDIKWISNKIKEILI